MEADIGTIDDDMTNLSFQRGFTLLNKDIMELVEQVRPQYDKGEAIEYHQQQIKAKQESLKRDKKNQNSEYYSNPIDVLNLGLPKKMQVWKTKTSS